ncbi:hypothetical protein WR25_04781 [Diploscapter pachys]|uniref:Uncharacterized protein n=1 Tax=Diploscapter pachys TaxID=2018661 RepID=A0A2A2L3Z5_9BILA|nr:hypothetical protein WR25_04781 [Diploscapter pachys]
MGGRHTPIFDIRTPFRLSRHNYYPERAHRPTQITRLLDTNCPPPVDIYVGNMKQQQISLETLRLPIGSVLVTNFQTDFKSADGEFEHDFFGQIADKNNLIYPNVLYRQLVLRKVCSKKNITPWAVESAEPAYS